MVVDVDFERKCVLPSDEIEAVVCSMWADYHECLREGSVKLFAPLLEEQCMALHEAQEVVRWDITRN